MSCWGYGITESDDAMDAESGILRAAGLDMDEVSHEMPVLRAALQGALPSILAQFDRHEIDRNQTRDRYKKAVGYQVLAAMLMENGCAMTEAQREALVAGATDDLEYSIAVHDEPELLRRMQAAQFTAGEIQEVMRLRPTERVQGRFQAIQGLVGLLRAYDMAGGTPVQTPGSSLFEAFEQERFAGAAQGAPTLH